MAPSDQNGGEIYGLCQNYNEYLYFQVRPLLLAQEYFKAATVANTLTPQEPGTPESLTIPGLKPGQQYYVAIKTADNYGNVSELFNVVQGKAKVK